MKLDKSLDTIWVTKTITYGGIDFIILDIIDNSKIFLLSKDIIFSSSFNSASAGRYPIQETTLDILLNQNFIDMLADNKADISRIAKRTIDLTTLEGETIYGKTIRKVSLLTWDEFKKYKPIIPRVKNPWWLATEFSTGETSNNSVQCAISKGNKLYNYYQHTKGIGVRPCFSLKLTGEEKIIGVSAEEILAEKARKAKEKYIESKTKSDRDM